LEKSVDLIWSKAADKHQVAKTVVWLFHLFQVQHLPRYLQQSSMGTTFSSFSFDSHVPPASALLQASICSPSRGMLAMVVVGSVLWAAGISARLTVSVVFVSPLGASFFSVHRGNNSRHVIRIPKIIPFFSLCFNILCSRGLAGVLGRREISRSAPQKFCIHRRCAVH